MGELLGALMRDLIGEGLEHLDRKLGGALSILTLACAGLACAMTSLAQDGNLRRLLPVTLVAALLLGAFWLFHRPPETEAAAQDEFDMDAAAEDDQRPG